MRLEELEREIRAERPEPETEFARRLDEWAAAGFPRGGELDPQGERSRSGGAVGWSAALRQRLAATPPRRLLAPVGAVATVIVIGAVAVGQLGELGGADEESSAPNAGLSAQNQPLSGGAAAQSESESPALFDESIAGEADVRLRRSDFGDERSPQLFEDPAALGPPASGGIARGTEKRLVDASARLTLGAEAGEVQEVANRVVEVTDSFEGVVLDSQVTTDQAGARASFSLEIPYRDLGAALADLSGLADVISLTEQGEDITARAVRTRKQLANVFDQIREARIELIRADTREERLIVKARIDSLEASAEATEQQLAGVKRQARFATVLVEVTSNGPEGASEGGWSLGDALGDAGRVLEVIGGIALIALAVLVPLALLGAIAWLVASRLRARGRERALDE